MTLAERVASTLRLVVLQVLDAAARHGVDDVNSAILRSAAREFGPSPDVATFNAELDWLADRKLVTLRQTGCFRVAALTELGADVAAGRATVRGVRRFQEAVDD